MKNSKEIITRAVILLCLSDRCALEKSKINGKAYSRTQRENQRHAIYRWLQIKGYIDFLTTDEKYIFELEVGKGNKDELLLYQIQYEAIEPCLWSLGFVQSLSAYDQFVLDDFHPILEIGMKHSINNIEKKVKLKTYDELFLYTEISMLWHWRAIEGDNIIFRKKSAKKIIIDLFGENYNNYVDQIQDFKKNQKDFIVNKKFFYELNEEEVKKITAIAQWRHYAFEWIIGDDIWNEVDIST